MPVCTDTSARIAFVHSKTVYDGNSLRGGPLGGTETVVVQLAEALAKRGHRVSVLTGISRPATINGVEWRPVESEIVVDADLAVAVSDATDFRYVRAQDYAVWIHNARTFDRFLRKGGAVATFRLRPAAVVLGSYHLSQVSKLIPYSHRVVIPHAIAEPFVDSRPASTPPGPRAIHFSQPYRDAENLVRIWVEAVHPHLPNAEFHLFCGDWHPAAYSDETLERCGVILRPRLSKPAIADEMRKARVMLYRGHKDETYCLAAAESIAMGLPVVTAGIGALNERVIHGTTGLLGSSDKEFADAAIRILTDDQLWQYLHEEGLKTRAGYSWDAIAGLWEKAFLNRRASGIDH